MMTFCLSISAYLDLQTVDCDAGHHVDKDLAGYDVPIVMEGQVQVQMYVVAATETLTHCGVS